MELDDLLVEPDPLSPLLSSAAASALDRDELSLPWPSLLLGSSSGATAGAGAAGANLAFAFPLPLTALAFPFPLALAALACGFAFASTALGLGAGRLRLAAFSAHAAAAATASGGGRGGGRGGGGLSWVWLVVGGGWWWWVVVGCGCGGSDCLIQLNIRLDRAWCRRVGGLRRIENLIRWNAFFQRTQVHAHVPLLTVIGVASCAPDLQHADRKHVASHRSILRGDMPLAPGCGILGMPWALCLPAALFVCEHEAPPPQDLLLTKVIELKLHVLCHVSLQRKHTVEAQVKERLQNRICIAHRWRRPWDRRGRL